MIDVNQLIDNVLGATMGTVGQDGLPRHPGPDTASGTTNPTGGRNPDATTTRSTQGWESTTERTRLRMSGTALAPESFTDHDAEAAGRNRHIDQLGTVSTSV